MRIEACRLALVADLVGHEVFFVVADKNVYREGSRVVARKCFSGFELRTELVGDQGFFDCGTIKEKLGWSGADD